MTGYSTAASLFLQLRALSLSHVDSFDNQLCSIGCGSSHNFSRNPDIRLLDRWVTKLSLDFNTISYFLARRLHCKGISTGSLVLELTYGHSLDFVGIWSRYYFGQRGMNVCALGWLVITFEVIRSSGFGRLSSAFNTFAYALIVSQRLRWRLPKIIFIVNRYFNASLLLCVTWNIYPRIYEYNMLEKQDSLLWWVPKSSHLKCPPVTWGSLQQIFFSLFPYLWVFWPRRCNVLLISHCF